jgi:hypothetical protein
MLLLHMNDPIIIGTKNLSGFEASLENTDVRHEIFHDVSTG